ncbi:MAG: helix-turn-helix domain-containing protein [Pyrinomonadaceae bacterium]
MNCFGCNQIAEIKKHRAYRYGGVSVENLYILNAEVLSCSECVEESLILPQVAKLHAAIGIAIALQPARLSGGDIKFLRRSAGFSLREWSERIGVAEATYSKWENAHRSISPQADRLARLHFLNAIKQKDPENIRVADYMATILSVDIGEHRNFAIAVDAENMEAEARYLPLDSPLLASPEVSFVEAQTLGAELMATVVIRGERSSESLASTAISTVCGVMQNASNDLALAA